MDHTVHRPPDIQACISWLKTAGAGLARESAAARRGAGVGERTRSRRRAGPSCRQRVSATASSSGRSAPTAATRWATSSMPSQGPPARSSPTRAGPAGSASPAAARAGRSRRTRRCGSPWRPATASASRRWSPGSCCGPCRPCPARAASPPLIPRAAPHQDLARARQMASTRRQPNWFVYTATALHSSRPGRPDLAGRRHHLVGEHWGDRRPAQQGPACLRPVRRGLRHSRPGVETIGALTDAGTELFWTVFGNPTQRRPLPRMRRRRPLFPSLAPRQIGSARCR